MLRLILLSQAFSHMYLYVGAWMWVCRKIEIESISEVHSGKLFRWKCVEKICCFNFFHHHHHQSFRALGEHKKTTTTQYTFNVDIHTYLFQLFYSCCDLWNRIEWVKKSNETKRNETGFWKTWKINFRLSEFHNFINRNRISRGVGKVLGALEVEVGVWKGLYLLLKQHFLARIA
jgi:hypothetical protein